MMRKPVFATKPIIVKTEFRTYLRGRQYPVTEITPPIEHMLELLLRWYITGENPRTQQLHYVEGFYTYSWK